MIRMDHGCYYQTRPFLNSNFPRWVSFKPQYGMLMSLSRMPVSSTYLPSCSSHIPKWLHKFNIHALRSIQATSNPFSPLRDTASSSLKTKTEQSTDEVLFDVFLQTSAGSPRIAHLPHGSDKHLPYPCHAYRYLQEHKSAFRIFLTTLLVGLPPPIFTNINTTSTGWRPPHFTTPQHHDPPSSCVDAGEFLRIWGD